MKKFLLTGVAMLLWIASNSQITLYSEDFDSQNTMPESITVFNFDGQNLVAAVVDLFDWEDKGWIVAEIPHEPNHNFAMNSSRLGCGTMADQRLILSDNPDLDIQKRIVVEYFTGTWCGACPRGAITLRDLLNKNPSLVPVAIHGGTHAEPMQTPEGNQVLRQLALGYPTGMIDRVKFQDFSFLAVADKHWEELVERRSSVPTPVVFEVIPEFNPEGNVIEVKLKLQFYESYNGPFAINAYIIEDRVVGGPDYDQANYFNEDPTSELFGRGNPIQGYEHRYVLRKMLGGPWGVNPHEHSIPNEIQEGFFYEYTFTYELEDGWNPDELYLAGYIKLRGGNHNSYETLNADFVKLTSPTSTTTLFHGDPSSQVHIYPNPANTFIEIAIGEMFSKDYTFITVYDLKGRVIAIHPHAGHKTQLDLSHYPEGKYYVSASDGVHRETGKFVIVR